MPSDAFDLLLSRRDPLTPPKSKSYVIGGNYEMVGRRFLETLVNLGGLKPDERVLDVGCGIGRVAVPLTGYLNEEGSYEGIDVIPEAIRWCQKNITPRYPNFKFTLADVYNKEYNQRVGGASASEYIFPYKDEAFDFVFLTSVFTHMLPDEVDNYLSQIARVLKPNGRCLITYFLLNQESLRLLAEGRSTIDFRHAFGVYRVKEKETPEAAVAYREEYVRSLYEKHGLRIDESIRYGKWCDRAHGVGLQDAVVAHK